MHRTRQRETNYAWIDDFYKDNENRLGMAVIKGDVIIGTEWILDDVKINHMLSGNDYDAHWFIRYAAN